MDGSLGIIYWIEDIPYISTRGSFVSDQAIKATKMLHTTYKDEWNFLRDQKNLGHTILFEIIYPENRIVVNYGEFEGLVILGAVENKTGRTVRLNRHPDEFTGPITTNIPIVKEYDGIQDFKKIRELNSDDNKEGFVIQFKSGFTVKMKFEEYCRLHKILTNVSTKTIWEYMRYDNPIEEVLDNVPDEFYDWVKKTKAQLLEKYHTIEKEATSRYEEILSELGEDFERKEFAEKASSGKFPDILFLMLDKRDYSDSIWKRLRPKYEKPFKEEEI